MSHRTNAKTLKYTHKDNKEQLEQTMHHTSALTNFLKVGLHLVELLGDLAPVHKARLDVVVQLEDDQAVVEVAVQVVHIGADAQAVHPVAVRCNHKKEQLTPCFVLYVASAFLDGDVSGLYHFSQKN